MKHLKGKVTEQLNLIVLALTVGGLLLLGFFIDIETIKNLVTDAGPWAPLVFILLKASTIVVAPLSGAPLYPVVGYLFGFWPGILYVEIGDFIGYSTAFFISRTLGYPFVRKIFQGKERSTLAKIVEHVGTTKGFLHMCLTCFALPELIAYGSGLSKLPYWKFILIYTPISVAVSSFAVLFGSLLDSSNLPLFLTIGAPLGAFAVIGVGGWFFLRGVREKDSPKD